MIENQNEQAGADALPQRGQKKDRIIFVEHAEGLFSARNGMQNAENVEITEQQIVRKVDHLRRDDDGEDHHGKQQLASLEFIHGEAVTGHRADERLQKCADDRDNRGIFQCRKKIQRGEQELEVFQCEMPRDPHDGGIVHIHRIAQRHAQHIHDGIQDDEGHAQQEEEAHDAPHGLAQIIRGRNGNALHA